MANKRFYRFNFNPWKKNINDCAIRSVSAAIGMSYIEVCKQFGVAYRRGYGLIRDTGIDLERIKTSFDEYFGNVTDFSEDVPDDLKGIADEIASIDLEQGIETYFSGITISEFIEMFNGQGRFLVGCVSPERTGHIAFVNCAKEMNFLVDTFDSSDFIVDSWMQIKKILPKSDPRHYVYDKDRKQFVV